MAYNPFSSFRKYQKFWMASILLLCMITFVLCTGAQGDLSNLLLKWFSPRRGEVVAKIDGQTMYRHELDKLKEQRNVANDFMLRAARVVMERVGKVLKDEMAKPNHGKDSKQKFVWLEAVEKELQVRTARPRYFEGGIKFDDLINFAVWRDMADRLSIDFVPESVQQMINLEIFAVIPDGKGFVPFFGAMDMRNIQYDLRRDHQNVMNDAFIYQALKDEFRVRTAQLALMTAQVGTYQARVGRDRNSTTILQNLKFKFPEEVRDPLTPAQIWDIYQQKRSQYDVALVPIKVEKFLDKVPEPTDGELQVFFEENKRNPYDPTSPTPGFMVPAQVKVEWIMADPTSPFYQRQAQIVDLLETIPPIGWSPAYPELVAAVRYAVGKAAFSASMEQNYKNLLTERTRNHAYAAAPLTEPPLPALLSYMGKPTPQSVAGFIAGAATTDPLITAPASYRAQQYRLHEKELIPLVAEEDKPRLHFAARLTAANAHPFPLAPLGFIGSVLKDAVTAKEGNLLSDAEVIERFLPLGAVESDLKKQHELVMAHKQVDRNMGIVKDRLDQLQGKETAINIAVRGNSEVPGFIKTYGLRHEETKDFLNQFSIDKASELQPLKESFDKYRQLVNIAEGRAGKQERLKEDDFWRLFFDSSEPSFSIAVGRYISKAWPPDLEIKSNNPNVPSRIEHFFDTAEKPILFWKTDDRDSRIPENLAEVRKEVVRAWKLKKAREKFALAETKRLAIELQKSGGRDRYGSILREEAAKLKVTPIYLNGVAELMPSFDQTGRTYQPFTVSKDEFEYPRMDMAKQILALTHLDKAEKPLNIGVKPSAGTKGKDTSGKEDIRGVIDGDLDALNSELLKGKNVQQIQVLTNRPQNTFYVAVVTHSYGANMGEFTEALRMSMGDRFLGIAQDEAAREFREALIAQLRQQLEVKIEADGETIKSFDTNVN